MSGAADPACAWRITLASTCTIVVAWRRWPRSSQTAPSASPAERTHADRTMAMRAQLIRDTVATSASTLHVKLRLT